MSTTTYYVTHPLPLFLDGTFSVSLSALCLSLSLSPPSAYPLSQHRHTAMGQKITPWPIAASRTMLLLRAHKRRRRRRRGREARTLGVLLDSGQSWSEAPPAVVQNSSLTSEGEVSLSLSVSLSFLFSLSLFSVQP